MKKYLQMSKTEYELIIKLIRGPGKIRVNDKE